MRKAHIFVVDDEEVVTQIVSKILEPEYDVTSRSTGRAALSYISGGLHYDLAIIDRSLPDISGDVVAEYSQRIHPEAPIIRACGYASAGMLKQNSTATAFLQKPFTASSLVNLVSRLLNEA